MSKLETIVKKASRLVCAAGLSLVLSLTGCSNSPVFHINHGRVIENINGTEPQGRIGFYPIPTFGTNFIDINNLGKHSYGNGFSENNGIAYTKKAGHIDIAHLRKAADWTAFLAAKTYENLKNNQEEFTFNLKEPSKYHVKIQYPENWQNLSENEREKIMYTLSIKSGQYFSYTASIWHEILTWFGYKSTGIISEFHSAFSWEDGFSNLLGTHIAVQALQDSQHEYNEAVTLALEKNLKELGAQSRDISRKAAEKVRGTWFSGDIWFFVDCVNITKRNFDIGEKGFLTAWNPLSNPQLQQLRQYPVPNSNLDEYGFSIKFELEPREFEKNKILNIIYPDTNSENNPGTKRDRIEPARHFPLIMQHIEQDAIRKYGIGADKPF